ncbi:relaxase/mobilization nuclease domain-containing protein [Mucilaginibacter sp. SMC90]|uniref:relaxase/mobilization nuclease domain-containing protein n=1 Tax=Mucilaginibacter sp. SMC90 TaxID=2929803 RepID=UPI001FB4C646|nr:relaxase/mobilization nuclease domain-containing protein [Mucilaginibacter sp. SMC90]UOE52572.1 relaxase/mobilization nuclease domain-containing protein [Mucilaginibacter sp. SMC90]
MIVKILSSSAKFSGVVYNTNKIDRNKGELMKVANFGSLQGLGRLRPQDYINYLKMIAAQNSRVKKPQFHAVLSAKGRSYNSKELTKIAIEWLGKMGYGDQPYLVIYHKDTDNNHVHMVSARVDKKGKKINSAYENLRAIVNLKEVLSLDTAFAYNFSTRAQFFMVTESLGLPGKEADEKAISDQIKKYQRPDQRIGELRELFQQYKGRSDFRSWIFEKYYIELLFHNAEGKQPYGYSIIDHSEKLVLKGSEVLALKHLKIDAANEPPPLKDHLISTYEAEGYTQADSIRPIWIAGDVDDQQVHGMRRRRQKKARTNTR